MNARLFVAATRSIRSALTDYAATASNGPKCLDADCLTGAARIRAGRHEIQPESQRDSPQSVTGRARDYAAQTATAASHERVNA
jgi:hypothetical protein